jgi:hypothetical protein
MLVIDFLSSLLDRLTKKIKKTLAMEADLFEVGYEVAMAKANIQLPILLKVRNSYSLRSI